MEKNKIKFILNNITKTFTYNGNDYTVKTYLPIEEKENLAELVIQESLEDGYTNTIKFDILFDVLVCMKYTNIDFSDYDEDIYALYDMLVTTGVLKSVINACEKDYNDLKNMTNTLLIKRESYHNSLHGTMMDMINSIPNRINEIVNELKEYDPKAISEILNQAKEIGGSEAAVYEVIKEGQ